MSETCKEFAERIWEKPLNVKELDLLLWHCTAFPCIDPDELEKQLIKVKEESGGDLELACKQADEEMNAAMANPHP